MLHKTLFAIVIVFWISCTEESTSDLKDTSEVVSGLNGTWKVVKFVDMTNNKTITDTPDNTFDLGREIIITFDDSQVPHKLHGANTTNYVEGTFEYLYQGQQPLGELDPSDRIEVHDVVSTYANQPKWADLFNLHFEGKMRYQITGDRLTFFNDKSYVIVFERK